MVDARQAAEDAARTSYGRLLAFLAARAGDVAQAEDALAEAFLAALRTWPARGVPAKPEAWLLTAARRNLMHEVRHRGVVEASTPILREASAAAQERVADDDGFPDERLKLLFVCSHPAIDAAARAPLMLQVVLGLDAARIASAFLVSPTAMGQRLVRAKARIRDARLRFEAPDEHELPERLDAVLEAIYAAYGSGWDDVTGGDLRARDLATEAIGLARLTVHLLPTAAEARGLLALMLHCEARRGARRSASGAFVPLSEQDSTLWSRPMIEEAERQLSAAGAARQVGHFQLEAAIQSAHASRAPGRGASREDIALLYEGLVRLAPTMGALVSRAAAVGDASGAERGLALLAEIPEAKTMTYQPYWALRAHLLSALGRIEESGAAYERAIGLSEDESVRAFLVERRMALRDRSVLSRGAAPVLRRRGKGNGTRDDGARE